jgi:hypothetical protein
MGGSMTTIIIILAAGIFSGTLALILANKAWPKRRVHPYINPYVLEKLRERGEGVPADHPTKSAAEVYFNEHSSKQAATKAAGKRSGS